MVLSILRLVAMPLEARNVQQLQLDIAATVVVVVAAAYEGGCGCTSANAERF